MGALIAAVLGCGPRGRAQLARHQERMEQQQQQQQSKACVQPQAPVPKQQPAPANLADLQAELDNLLGLSPTRGGQAAVARSRADAEVLAAECSSRELAPANAELAAAAVERARVARTCPSTDISCSSACNRSSPGKLGSRGSSSSTVQDKDSKPPWKPSSPRLPSSHGQNQQQQQQEWKQWQQSPAPVSSGSPSKGRARTPSPARHHGWQAQQQQQQAPELPVLACVRCGQQEGDNMGPCCFHPGLVAAPGPLMYGQEWHACRTECTSDMPGCYTRKEHFFTPMLDSHGRGKATGGAAPQPDACKAVACRSAGAMRQGQRPVGSPSRLSPHPHGTSPGCSSPRAATAWATSGGASAGRQGAKWGSAAASPHEPKPRSTLPKPSLYRG